MVLLHGILLNLAVTGEREVIVHWYRYSSLVQLLPRGLAHE
jgi:hypothetical protein